MHENLLVVNSQEFENLVAARPFVALPQEERERLFAAIEISIAKRSELAQRNDIRALVAYTAMHHNYSWLTCLNSSNLGHNSAHALRTLLLTTPLVAESSTAPLFLDDATTQTVQHQVALTTGVVLPFELRLVGILNNEVATGAKAPLGLVYVARLRQAGAISVHADFPQLRWCGNSDLRQTRQLFEPNSKTLIDQLDAL